jgi:hypothetical protein
MLAVVLEVGLCSQDVGDLFLWTRRDDLVDLYLWDGVLGRAWRVVVRGVVGVKRHRASFGR